MWTRAGSTVFEVAIIHKSLDWLVFHMMSRKLQLVLGAYIATRGGEGYDERCLYSSVEGGGMSNVSCSLYSSSCLRRSFRGVFSLSFSLSSCFLLRREGVSSLEEYPSVSSAFRTRCLFFLVVGVDVRSSAGDSTDSRSL